jgi:hypothetical protein
MCFSLALLAPAVEAAGPPEWLLGNWVLNSERTHELQPEQSSNDGSGFGSPSISVGGVFIPLPGGSQPSTGGARDPNVLRCASMTVAMQGPDIHFSYTGAGEEVMKAGNNQGRKSSWNTSKLTQKYTTTSRSVTKTYQLDSDGLLVVKVKINPKGSKSATHVRAFQRPGGLTPEAEK